MVNHQAILKKGLWVLLAVGLVQLSAQKIGLYWIYPNLDIPMHFFGGVWLGFLATWAVLRFSLVNEILSFTYLFFVGLIALFVGLGWEAFEYIIGAGMQLSPIDTQLDLVMDLLGAYVVALFLLISAVKKHNYVSTK